MTSYFPSVNGLTWQEWRTNNPPMESTEKLADRSREGRSAIEADPSGLSNRERIAELLGDGAFYHGPDRPCAPHLPVGSPARAALFEALRETFPQDWAAAERAVERERRKKLGNLYFVTAANAVKIGRTTNMSVRLRHIQAHNHEQVKCVLFLEGDGWRERDYHRRFRAHHLRGEWFRLCPEIEAEIARLRAQPQSSKD